jgi:hypothetical protein
MTALGNCAVCGLTVDSVQSHARRICGWEAVRKGTAGANRIIDRVQMDGIAHVVCVESRAKHRRLGIADEQGRLT